MNEMYCGMWRNTFQFRRFFLSTLLFVFPMGAYGQESVDPLTSDSTLRAKYANSRALPDALAFKIAIGTVSELYVKKPSLAQSIVRNRMSMDNAQSVAFLAKLIVEHESLESDISSARIDLLCSQGVPKVTGPDVYTALDAADDAEEQIARTHLISFRRELTGDQSDKLERWIEESKDNTVYMKFDHRKLYEQQGVDPDAVIPLLCGQ